MKFLIIFILMIPYLGRAQEILKYKETGKYMNSTSFLPPNDANDSKVNNLKLLTGSETYIRCYFYINSGNYGKIILWGESKNSNLKNIEYSKVIGSWFDILDPKNNVFYTNASFQELKNSCQNAYINYSKNKSGVFNFENDFISLFAASYQISADNEFWNYQENNSLTFDKIIILGDSLSDNKNLFNKFLFQFPRTDAYFNGRFTNGQVWVEYIAKSATNGNIINFAEGGSEIIPKDAQGEIIKSLEEQYNLLNKITNNNNINFEKTLFIVFSGGNDFLNQTYNDNPQKLANEFIKVIEKLVANKAKYILIPNFFDITLTPRYQELSKTDPKFIKKLQKDIEIFNEIVNNKIIELMSNNKIIIIKPDFEKFLEIFFNKKDIFNITNDYCNKSGYDITKSLNICKEPLKYLFWDEIHPTTKGHCYLANSTIEVINSNLNLNTPTIENCNLNFIK